MKRHINKFGRLHSDNGPALIDDFNNKFYFQDGILHRLDGPAIEFANGDQVWYKNGLIHRDGNLPATLYNMNKSFNTWEFLNEHEKKNKFNF